MIWRLMVVRGGSLGELARCCSVAASGPPDVTGTLREMRRLTQHLQRLLQRIFTLVSNTDLHLLPTVIITPNDGSVTKV